jgi:aarF domain-containing kinase
MLQLIHRLYRTLRVAWDATIIYWGYKRTQRRVRSLTTAQADAAWEAQHDRSAQRLYRLCIDLKGLYIKAGQFIGTRADLVPYPYVRWLGQLQDRVPPRPVAEVRATIEREFGRSIEELFAEFDDEPLAAASLAQVHRARLPDGRDVAVKVQYPEVEELVDLDLRNLRAIVRLVAWREPRFDYRAIWAESAQEIPHELDFVREAAMQRRVAVNLQSEPRVILPEVVDTLLTRRVLLTTYIDGVGILDREALERHGVDRVALAETLAGAYGRQIIVDGLFQADPHPGNILVCPDGTLALLDFGLTKQLTDETRFGFSRMIVAASQQNPIAVMETFKELGIRTKHDDPASILNLVRLLFDARPVAGDQSLVQESHAALDYNPIHAIPSDLILIGRVIGLLRGVSASMDIPFTPMEWLLPYAEAVLEGRPPPRQVGPFVPHAPPTIESAPSAQ